MNWISVKNKLPERRGKYLVLHELYSGDFDVEFAYFYLDAGEVLFMENIPNHSKNVFVWLDEDTGWEIDEYVKYWCEVPDYSYLQ
jgi:hypothetical protein